MKHLTIRNLPAPLAQALEEGKRRRGRSLNQTVVELLSHALGHGPTAKRSNGLARLAGTWTLDEQKQFDAAIAGAEQVDEDVWR